MQQVLSSMYPDGPLPSRISHSELANGSGLPDPLPECFVFLNPYDDDALRLQQELARRYPDGRLLPSPTRRAPPPWQYSPGNGAAPSLSQLNT